MRDSTSTTAPKRRRTWLDRIGEAMTIRHECADGTLTTFVLVIDWIPYVECIHSHPNLGMQIADGPST